MKKSASKQIAITVLAGLLACGTASLAAPSGGGDPAKDSAAPIQQTKAPIVLGMDHAGINVPNIEKAEKFFAETFGFVAVTQIGPFQLDAAWKKRYHIRPNAELEKIAMLRTGNGSNLELFQYKSPDRSTELPYSDDLAWYHLAFYTEDMDAAVAALKAKGVRVLNDPIVAKTGPTAGESWVYFLTPWGAQMELVSYPKGKGYETQNPEVTLWSPKEGRPAASSVSASSAGANAQLISTIDAHTHAINETDPVKMAALIERAYTKDVQFVDSHAVIDGQKALAEMYRALQQKYPGQSFEFAPSTETSQGVARLKWQQIAPGKPPGHSGEDIITFENGKIRQVLVFLDKKD